MKPRVVLDTNVFISAILYGGNPRKVVHLAVTELIEVYISLELLEEFGRVIKGKFTLRSLEIDTIIPEIKDFAEIATPQVRLQVIKSDPSDDKVLECAVETKARFIVTGDKHLLHLGNFRGITIVNPTEFLKIYKKG